jgi:hypothetical protein
MAQPFRAPLDAVAGTVPINAVQTATVVSEIASRLQRWLAITHSNTVIVPGLQDVSILHGGSVWWCRGRAVPVSHAVAALGALLAALLDHTAAHRAPAGLLYIVARATDPRHLAPFADLAEFHGTLSRYAASRPNVALDSLAARYAAACSGLPPLDARSTIADVRRLRRAGGVTLAQIAADTAIPISLLRELEWGVYTYWNLEHARGLLELYTERAGLDGDAVARVIEQEQALMVHERVQPDRLPTRVSPDAASLEPAILPYALAGLLMGAVFLAAPGERSVPPSSLHDPPAASLKQVRTVTLPEAEARPASIVRPPLTSVAHARPRRNRTSSTALSRPVFAPPNRRAAARNLDEGDKAQSRPAAHPLAKLARTIAGDGRFKVEPFPTVKDEK